MAANGADVGDAAAEDDELGDVHNAAVGAELIEEGLVFVMEVFDEVDRGQLN